MSDTPVGLTTLEALRLHVLRNDADATQDAKLTAYGEALSERVKDMCPREFVADPASEDDEPVARDFFYDGSGLLDLAPYDLRELTAISINPELDTAVDLATTEYRLNPRNGTRQGTYLSLDLIVPRHRALVREFDWTVRVTGRWGMAEVPKAVELAVWIAVDEAIKNPGSYATQQLGGYTITEQQPNLDFDADARGALPRAALWALAPYRRRRGRRINSVQLRRPHASCVDGERWP